MVREAALILCALMVAGCKGLEPHADQLADCERGVKAALKAPSTYKNIDRAAILIDDHKPPYLSVSIEYDAANSYGTPIREREICAYKLSANGQATLETYDLTDLFSSKADELETAASLGEQADHALENASEAVANAQDAIAASEDATPVEALPRDEAEQYPGGCYKDYCPCEPPQGGPDQLLCDRIEEGLPVEADLMISGRAMRKGRAELEAYQNN